LGITPDGQYLNVLCFFDGLEIFNVADPTALVSQQRVVTTGSQGDYPIYPFYTCVSPGGTFGVGVADGRTFQAYMNNVNATYSEVNALLTVIPDVQIATFPSTGVIIACAITEKAVVIATYANRIQFFKTTDPTAPFYSDPVKCPAMVSVGSFLGYEHFFHNTDTACNCGDTAITPCPPGMALAADYPISEYTANFTSGYFLSGRDYMENGYMQKSSTSWTDATWPVEFVNTNGTLVDSLTICDPATRTVIIPPNETRFQGKWVLIAPYTWADTRCPADAYAFALRDAGANGVMRALIPGQSVYYIVTIPYLDIPFFAISNDMFVAVATAAAAPIPTGPVSSPSGAAYVRANALLMVMVLGALLMTGQIQQ
jgi:hypothetical protein